MNDKRLTSCKDCAERQLGCHQTCKKYQTWKKAHDECMTMLRKEAEADYLCLKREGKKNRRKFHF